MIHLFDSTGDAYDACQCGFHPETGEDIRTGDTLYIPSEGVIGVADTWPFAVTANHGALHQLAENAPAEYLDMADEAVHFAIREGLRTVAPFVRNARFDRADRIKSQVRNCWLACPTGALVSRVMAACLIDLRHSEAPGRQDEMGCLDAPLFLPAGSANCDERGIGGLTLTPREEA